MKGNWVFSHRFRCPVKVVSAGSRITYYHDGTLSSATPDSFSPIPLSHEILARICSSVYYHPGTSATEEVTYYIVDRLKIKHNTEDWRHEYFCVEGIPYELKWLHQLQQIFTICGIEKEITLGGISVKEG